MSGSRAVFLDRDGVLTWERKDYVKTPEELEIMPGIGPPLRELRSMGFRLVVVTNQSVVGRGLATEEQLGKIHDKLRSELEELGCRLDAIYYCPHVPGSGCDCRKPEPGLILRAASDLRIDVGESWMIGDKEMDVEAARRAGCRGIRIGMDGIDLASAVSRIELAEKAVRDI